MLPLFLAEFISSDEKSAPQFSQTHRIHVVPIPQREIWVGHRIVVNNLVGSAEYSL